MNTKLIMTSSAVTLAFIGVGLTFMPVEVAAYIGAGNVKTFPLIMQLLGALYFAFAMLNWMAKGSVIGGIYNRPIAIANFTHFAIGALALVKAVISQNQQPAAVMVLTVVYGIFALLFAWIFNTSPVNKTTAL